MTRRRSRSPRSSGGGRTGGRLDYPTARRLLITADAGGSNGYRTRAWKTELARLAAESGLEITVCHLPPGTSKWNKIEHRLFCHITLNWRGRPLTSHQVIVNSIAATTTRTGPRVTADLDQRPYPTGVEISDAQFAAVPLRRHHFHGDWNYSIAPPGANPTDAGDPAVPAQPATDPDRAMLSHPELTGMSRSRLDNLVTDLTADLTAHREHQRRQRRGAERIRAPGAGRHPKLTDPDRILATVLYQRKLCTQAVLADMFKVDRKTITIAVRDVTPLLQAHGHTVTPSTARFTTPSDVTAFLTTPHHNPTPPRPNTELIQR
jgi:hypothetical protein